MAAALIAHGANINLPNNRGNTPLHYAAAKKDSVRTILESVEIHPDRDINAIWNAILHSARGPIPLNDQEVLATKQNIHTHFNALKKVVDSANNPNRQQDIAFLEQQHANFSGKSLINACMEGRQAVIELLLANKLVACNSKMPIFKAFSA